jgi:hypothetical protein
MSAEERSTAAPAPVNEGPVIITVAGQEPEAQEAPAAAAAPATEAPKATGSEEPAPDGNRDDKGRFKGGVQDRIDELTRARREAEREAEYWRVRATGEAPGAAKPATPAQPQQPVAPTRDKFATDAEYIDALADFKVDQKLAQRDQQAKVQTEATAKAQSWDQKLAAARTEIPDFDNVMDNSTAQVAGHVAELIMEHDDGAKVAHFFASNPDALEAVNAMSPAKAAFEIGKVAAKFAAADAAKAAGSSEPAVEVKVSKAPPPAGRQVGASAATAPSLEDLSMDEYVARRKSQGASWAR